MRLVLIHKGDFLMGSPDSDPVALPDEKPRHHVRIDHGFYLGVHEVTVGQFRAFVEATGYTTRAETGDEGGPSTTRGSRSMSSGRAELAQPRIRAIAGR